MTSEQGTEELARVSRPRSRTRIDSWALPVIRILPYLLAALVVIVPLVLAFAGDSLLASYEGIREAFGRGRVINGVAGLLQILLFAIAVTGLALTFALVGRRLGAIVWRWSEGKPILRAGLSSVRFGLAIVAVATVGVALFTWLPSGDRATADGGTLKEAMERAGNQVATLLGAESDTASAEEADSEASAPAQFLENLAESILPQRDREEESSDDSGSSTSSQGPSSKQAGTKEQDDNETARPKQQTSDTAQPNPVTLAPRGPVPTVAEAPPVISEEPASAPTAAPIAEPAAEEPAAEEPAAEEPAAEEPPVTEEPPPVAEEPSPVAEEPPPTGPPPPTTEPPETPPTTEPPEEVSPDAPPGTPKALLINCTSSPGEEPGSTSTRCGT